MPIIHYSFLKIGSTEMAFGGEKSRTVKKQEVIGLQELLRTFFNAKTLLPKNPALKPSLSILSSFMLRKMFMKV